MNNRCVQFLNFSANRCLLNKRVCHRKKDMTDSKCASSSFMQFFFSDNPVVNFDYLEIEKAFVNLTGSFALEQKFVFGYVPLLHQVVYYNFLRSLWQNDLN